MTHDETNAMHLEEIQFNDELLAIAPWHNTLIGCMDDPGHFMSDYFAEASQFICHDWSNLPQIAKIHAKNVVHDMTEYGVDVEGSNFNEQREVVEVVLTEFLQDWHKKAIEKFGLERLKAETREPW